MQKKIIALLLCVMLVLGVTAIAAADTTPSNGVYLGGSVDKFYPQSFLTSMTDAQTAQFNTDLMTAGFANTYYYFGGKIATITDLASPANSGKAFNEIAATYAAGTLNQTYTNAQTGATYNPDSTQAVTVSAISATQTLGVVEVTAAGTTADALKAAITPAPTSVALKDGNVYTVTLANAAYDQEITLEFAAGFTVQAGVSNKVKWNAPALAVESVSAVNPKEITVVFSKALDKTTAETATNYVVPGRIVTPVLQSDKKTVLLTVNVALILNTETTLTVNGVKNEAKDQTVTNIQTKFTPTDTVIPSVTETKVISPTKLQITFSEPVQSNGAASALAKTNFKIDTVALAAGDNLEAVGSGVAAGLTAPAGYKTYNIIFAAPLPVGTHKLLINADNGIKDYAAFIVPASEPTVTIQADTTAPQVVSATALSRTKVQVKFNKVIDETTLNGNKFYWNTTGNAANNAKTGDAGTVANKTLEKIDDTTYNIPFTTNFFDVGNVYLFNVNTINDLTGNPFPTKSIQLTVAADTQPQVTGVVALSDKIFEVRFNKAMDNTATVGALTKAYYTFKDSNGKVLVLGTNFDANGHLGAGATVTLNATKDVATIVFGTALPADTYSVTVEKMKDSVGVALPAAQTLTVTPTDTTPVTAGMTLSGRTYSDGTNVYFIVTFPEAMATTGNYSVLTASKWVFNTAAAGTTVAPTTALSTLAGATLTASADAKSVTIAAPVASWTNANDYAFGLTNFADKSGNIQTASTYTGIGASGVNVLVAASSGIDVDTGLGANVLNVTDTKTVTLKLPKQLQTIDAADFEIKEGAATYDTTTNTTKMLTSVTYVNNADGTSTVTFVLNKDLDLTANIAVATKAVVNTTDSDGLKLVVSKATNTTGLTVGTDVAKVQVKPVLKGASLVNDTTIDLVFDQNMTIANKADFIVTENGQTKAVTAAAATANHITLTFAAGTFNVSSAPQVATITQDMIQSEGAFGTKMTAVTTAIAVKNVRVSSVVFANGEAGANSTTAAVADTITITFSTAVDPLSLGFVAGEKNASTGEYTHTATTQNIESTVAAGVGAGNEDTSTIGVVNKTGIGTIKYFEPTTTTIGGADGGAGRLDAKLSADGKTLTLTFTAVDATAKITNANFSYITFIPANTIKDVEGNFINLLFNPQTSSKF